MQYKGQNSRLFKFHVVDEFCCPACGGGYICITYQKLGTRRQEHCDLDNNSLIFNHPPGCNSTIIGCNLYQYILTVHSFQCNVDVPLAIQDILESIRTTVTVNVAMRKFRLKLAFALLKFALRLNIK